MEVFLRCSFPKINAGVIFKVNQAIGFLGLQVSHLFPLFKEAI